MILAGQEIAERFPDLPRNQINAASIDVRLSPNTLIEYPTPTKVMDLRRPDRGAFLPMTLKESGTYLPPGMFLLGSTIETIDLRPHPDLSAILQLKSSIGRCGLEHLTSGWIDSEFHGTITLELKNMLTHNAIKLYPGMLLGQLIFHRHTPATPEFSYREKGRYNGQHGVTLSKGVGK